MAKVKKSATEVATVSGGGLPALLMEEMKRDAGKGVSTAQEDNLVPLIYVLQPLSPQLNKRDSKYIEGAEAGSIWLKNAPEDIAVINGEEGVLFQPCYFGKDWVEWIPREQGGGLVARHTKKPANAKETKDPQNPNRIIVKLGDHDLKETRYHFGFVHVGANRYPYCIPLTSTGHTVSRDLMTRMRSKALPDGTPAPAWGYLYRLKTTQRQNKSGTWFQFAIEDEGWITKREDYDMGKALFTSLEAGEKIAADVEAEADPDKM